jgi:oligoribonuclease (3'-5' exoribonuclease)
MNYFSIDIETTGLNPDKDQVLQIGAVYAPDRLKDVPVEMLPTFNILVKHERYEGDAFALALNAQLLQRLGNKEGISEWSAMDQFIAWINDTAAEDNQGQPVQNRRYTMAGKNVASFDRQFLRRMTFGDKFNRMFHHRAIDPAVWYYQDGDRELPGMDLCLTQLANEKPMLDAVKLRGIKHDAVSDARTVVRLIRGRMGGLIA